VTVVGASLAGLRAAEGLRRGGWSGEIMVVGDEPHRPYDRPSLSKQALADGAGGLPGGELRVARVAGDVRWVLGRRAETADLTARTVTLDDGLVLGWDGLVVATGLRPARLDLPGPTRGRHVLRDRADAAALREVLRPGARLVVVGAGFVGCEVAATARGLGVEVDVVAPERVPAQRTLGELLGGVLRRAHEEHGVRFHLGTVPVGYEGGDRVEGVLLADGTRLPADAVLEAVGSVPNVSWLRGNALDLGDGVRCDGSLRVLTPTGPRPDVVACGDVARFPLPDGVPRRVEHWTSATETGRHAGAVLARYLTGVAPDDRPFAPVPSFWSDQYDLRLQSFGTIGDGDVRVLEGDPDGEVAVGYHREGVLTGVVLVGLAHQHRTYRDMVAGGSAVGTAPVVGGIALAGTTATTALAHDGAPRSG